LLIKPLSKFVLIICILITLTGCSTVRKSQSNDQLILMLQNSLILDNTYYIGQFLNIIDEIKRDPDKKDYIDGMINNFIQRENYPSTTVHSVLTQTNISSKTASQIIDQRLSSPLNKLFTSSMPSYLNKLKKEKSYNNIDQEKLSKIEKQFIKFNGSSERYTEKNSVEKILKAVIQLNDLLK
jgi:hypothetical protein